MASHASKEKHRHVHHLSQRGDHDGWVEGITGLNEENPATKLLLDENVKVANGRQNKVNGEKPDGNVLTVEEEFNTRLQHALESLVVEVEAQGESLIEVGSADGWGPTNLSEAELDKALAALEKTAISHQADVTIERRRKLAVPTATTPTDCYVADAMVRLRAGVKHATEVRVAVIGNVDSGKSTMVGVLTRGILDDGRGLARSKVFKHGHESETGRTSSIGQHNLCLDSKGKVLNDVMFRTTSCGEYVARASKVITLVDLAGHERYFKTTAYGLTGHLPDYACLIVGANAGLVGMCKEHLGVALALKVPVFFVVTKIDLAPAHVMKHTLTTLNSILKKPGVRKKPFLVRSHDDVVTCARHMTNDSLAPIILTSAVTGEGLDLVRAFYNLLPQRQNWAARAQEKAEFIIDETFTVQGVGTVVAGTVKKGVINAASNLVLGPDIGDGMFKPAAVKSLHYKRCPVSQVVAGQTAALALKKVKRAQVRKGMVLLDEQIHPVATWEFDADIAILTHSTTIQPRYQAVIHCEIVCQSARVVAMDKERLRSGDRACVRFRFLQRPEYISVGTRFVFREGRTKGIGMVIGVS